MLCIRGTSHVPVSVRLSVSLSQVGVPHLDLVKLSDDVIRTRGTKYKLIQHHCCYDLRKFTFTDRVLPIWNSLSNHVVSADTVNCFKTRSDKLWSNQEVLYNHKADLHGTGNSSVLDGNFVILKFYRKVYFSDTEASM